MTMPAHRRAAALALMLCSGFAGLGYQMVWTQQSALWLGAESAAVLAVVTAFFGGLSCGYCAGAALYQRWWARGGPVPRAAPLPTWMTLACLAGTASLWAAPAIGQGLAG